MESVLGMIFDLKNNFLLIFIIAKTAVGFEHTTSGHAYDPNRDNRESVPWLRVVGSRL